MLQTNLLRGKSKSSQLSYKSALNTMHRYLGDKPFEELVKTVTQDDINTLFNVDLRTLSFLTKRQYIGILKSLFQEALFSSTINRERYNQLISFLDFPKNPKIDESVIGSDELCKIMNFLSQSNNEKDGDTYKNYKRSAMVALMLSGVRPSETEIIRLSNIHYIELEDVYRIDFQGRTVWTNQLTTPFLKIFMKKFGDKRIKTEFLFGSVTPPTRTQKYYIVGELCQVLDLPEITPNKFFNTWYSRLMNYFESPANDFIYYINQLAGREDKYSAEDMLFATSQLPIYEDIL